MRRRCYFIHYIMYPWVFLCVKQDLWGPSENFPQIQKGDCGRRPFCFSDVFSFSIYPQICPHGRKNKMATVTVESISFGISFLYLWNFQITNTNENIQQRTSQQRTSIQFVVIYHVQTIPLIVILSSARRPWCNDNESELICRFADHWAFKFDIYINRSVLQTAVHLCSSQPYESLTLRLHFVSDILRITQLLERISKR